MLARDWKLRPTMPLIKEKPLLPPPHPPMALTNLCLPECIWGTIVPTWLVKLGLKALHNQRQIQENQEVTTTIKEGLHHRLGNMDFEFLVLSIVDDYWLQELLDNMFYSRYMSNIFENNFKFHELNLPKVNMLMGETRRCVLLN